MIDPNTGKEYFLDPKRAQEIQNKINIQKEMPDSLKQGITKKEQKDMSDMFHDGISDVGSDLNGFSGEGYGINNNTFIDGDNSLANRISYYDTFQQMSQYNFIHRGLQIIADDATQKNIEGDTVKVYSDDDDIKQILEDMFHRRLNLNKELWSIVYETCKLGDNFYEIIPDSYDNPHEIVRIRYLDPSKTNRIEKNGKLAFYTYTTDMVDNNGEFDDTKSSSRESEKGKKILQYRLQPWQIIHFRISDKDFYPYGGSLLKSGVSCFRRLTMLEDAMVIYRLARVPERRVFKIGVGNLSTSEANRYVQRIKDNYRTSQILDDKGNINRTASALSITQDIFIPVRDGETSTEVTDLSPGQGLNNIDDIRYFRDQILWTMNIPPEYLGFTSENGGGGGGGDGRGSLAMQDIKFARFVERIQFYIEEGLTKCASIELFFKHKKKTDLKNFRLELTAPSNVKEIMDIEYLNQKMSLIQSMIGTNLFSNEYILKYVMKLSKKEIDNIILYKGIQDQKNAAAQAGGAGMGGMDMGMGGGAPADIGGAASPAPDMGGGAAAPAPEVAPAASVITDSDDIVNIFGKDVVIKDKKNVMELVKAMEEYKKEKDAGLIKEDEEDKTEESGENLIEMARDILSGKEHAKTNDISSSLYFENEFDGIDFNEEKFTVYGKPHKRSGPSGNGKSPRIIIEEVTKKLKK